MTIYEFASILNDCELIVFTIFDCNSENRVFITDDEDDERTEFNIDELLESKYADCEVGSIDMWMKKGKIYIEFNIDIEEDDFEWLSEL
jgi:hypothetical protein